MPPDGVTDTWYGTSPARAWAGEVSTAAAASTAAVIHRRIFNVPPWSGRAARLAARGRVTRTGKRGQAGFGPAGGGGEPGAGGEPGERPGGAASVGKRGATIDPTLSPAEPETCGAALADTRGGPG